MGDAKDLSLGLTIADAATAMGVARRTLERWIASGAIAVVRHGRVVRISPEEIERFRRTGTVAPVAARPPRRSYGRGRVVAPNERLWD